MGKIFKKISRILGPILMFVPGLQFVGAALLIGSAANEYLSQKKQAKAMKRAIESQASSQNVMVKQAIMDRRIVYGRARVGGIMVYLDSTENNKYLHLVLALCDGPVQAIDEIWFADQLVTLDGSGNGTGKWADKVRVKKYLGTDSQTADTDLINEGGDWTSSDRLLGVAYIYVRLTFDPEVFPVGLPNISATVVGRNDIIDGRDDSTGYTTNVALCQAHYLSLNPEGPKFDLANDLDQDEWDAAANVCDEQVDLIAAGNFTVTTGSDANQVDSTAHGLFDGQIVRFTSTGTLPAGISTGTDYFVINAEKDSFEVCSSLDDLTTLITMSNKGTGVHSFTAKEFRYTFNGVVTIGQVEDNVRLFRDAMAGAAPNIGGWWYMQAGAYRTPDFTVTADRVIGEFRLVPKRSKRERINTVKGFYMAARNRFQPSDYPPITNSTYITEDGEELIEGFDFPATNSPSMAQRIAKILLESLRYERVIETTLDIEALKTRAGSTVTVNIPRYNINSVPFEVDFWDLQIVNGEARIPVVLRETNSSIYSWTPGTDEDEVVIDSEPDLPDGSVTEPTLTTPFVNVSGGRQLVGVEIAWTQTTDEFVLKGGSVIVQWKKTSDSDWEESITKSGDSVKHLTAELEQTTNYDFRVAFRNKFGGQSVWSTETSHLTVANTNSAYAYSHQQVVPATVWTITHNLGYRPGQIRVIQSNGRGVNGAESKGSAGDPTGENEIEVSFNSAIAGIAYLS